ncbi:uncharacterized protein TM35_000481580 [Trypanosoma theileri]|uniref:Uncharacterized protein n=1 Tax=Trypanosoma theileri TaxID=67003 RepID=A0A1X0NHQ9_9TRYP|nr:uncharacterized protein TM35_000481580 [Trypanosoma theileri]ORC84197.1 hypothetical protein TM35_000481580 [Trypanosoma theileri]
MKCTFSHVLVTFISLLFIFGCSLSLVADATNNNNNTTTETAALTPFRCMRPFGSLSRFSPSAMNAAENCKFGSFRILNASAVLNCTHAKSTTMSNIDGQSTQAEENDKMLVPGCNAVIRIVFKMEEENKFGTTESNNGLVENDIYRFSLQLRAFNDSVVHYKGFDQNGYSMCCDLIQEGECVWEKNGNLSQTEGKENISKNTETSEITTPQREPVVVSCPLYNKKIAKGNVFHGSLIKPLHRLAVTEWEARLEFWRGVKNEREVLGRLLLPFKLTESDLAFLNESNRDRGTTGVSTNSWNNVGALVEGKKEGVKEFNREDDL